MGGSFSQFEAQKEKNTTGAKHEKQNLLNLVSIFDLHLTDN